MRRLLTAVLLVAGCGGSADEPTTGESSQYFVYLDSGPAKCAILLDTTITTGRCFVRPASESPGTLCDKELARCDYNSRPSYFCTWYPCTNYYCCDPEAKTPLEPPEPTVYR